MAPYDLKQRTFKFAVLVGRLIEQLPATTVNRAYSGQIVRSSSSVGANYRAAQRAKSGRDFINKLKIVEEEADETIYFLELLLEFNEGCRLLIDPLLNEGTEILKIIVASIITAKNKLNNEQKK